MSSKSELKARSEKRFAKKQVRVMQKKVRAEEPENRLGDYLETMLPIPAKRGSNNGVLPKKRKAEVIKTDVKISKITPHSTRKSADGLVTDFTNVIPFTKKFWTGPGGEEQPSEALKSIRKEIGVLVKGNLAQCPAPVDSIHSSSLPKSFVSVCAAHKVTKPSAVQKQCWPAILYGANLLGIAPTGSGKTLAYCLPVIPHIEAQLLEAKQVHSKRKFPTNTKLISPIALVLVPTRELALQVVTTLKPMKRLLGITSGAVYGGIDKNEQLQKLKAGCGDAKLLHVLVATPGRLEDFLYTASSGNSLQMDLSQVTYLVIDEADRMLSMGFTDQLNAISRCIRPDRQALLFSATFPGRLREVAESWVKDAVVIRCSAMEFHDYSKEAGKEEAEAAAAEEAAAELEGGEDGEPDLEGVLDGGATEEVKCEPSEVENGEAGPASKKAKVAFAEAALLPGLLDGTAESAKKTSSLTISHTVQQKIHVCASHKKPRLLIKYVNQVREKEKADKVRQAGPMIIFCNKIKTLKFVHDFLKRQDIRADALHGQLAQHVRESILANFKSVNF
jgi:superfamily II DNA/RNA helicase